MCFPIAREIQVKYAALSSLCVDLFRYGILKNVTPFRTIGPSNGLLAANIVEQNIGQRLSESEFYADSNNSSLIPPNWTQESRFSLEVS